MRLALLFSVLFVATAIAGSRPPPVETHVIATGRAPCGAAFRAGSGSLWVGVYETGTLLHVADDRVAARIRIVYRIDPTGHSVVDSFPAGPGPFALVRAGNSVWVTSFAGANVRRYDR